MTFLENIDKANLKKIMLVVISVLTLVALALLLVIIVMSIDPSSPAVPDTLKESKEYTVTDKDINTGSLILADNDHPYSYAFSDDELKVCGEYRSANIEKDANGNSINKYYMNDMSGMKLTNDAMAAAHKMLTAAEAAIGEDELCIDSTYGLDEESKGERKEYATAQLIYLARIISSTAPNEKLGTSYANWLDAHAAEFGFIESFENGYRYVGTVHAANIAGNAMINSLADYITYLKENTAYNKMLKTTLNGVEYAVYYVPCKAGDTIQIPVDGTAVISGTNEGGVIVTVDMSK